MILRVLQESFSYIRFARIASLGTGVLFVFSIVAIIVWGFDTNINFRGGIVMEFDSSQPLNTSDIYKALNQAGYGSISVKEYNDNHGVLVSIPGKDFDVQEVVHSVRGTVAEIVKDVNYRRVEVVGPQISNELVYSSIVTILVAIVCMFLYIWVRFRWQFGISAVVALIHDCGLVLGCCALFQFEVTPYTLAGLLGLIGYSINDSIIVSDRIRSLLYSFNKATMNLKDVFDNGVRNTMRRTINTSCTTLFASFSIYWLGPEAVSSLALIFMIGVIVGTWSSVVITVYLAYRFFQISGVFGGSDTN